MAIGHLRPMTLEGCVVRVSDIIAYVGKDRQDAILAGLVSPDAFDDGLGGAYYLFLRGMPDAGVYFHRPDDALLDALDRLFEEGHP